MRNRIPTTALFVGLYAIATIGCANEGPDATNKLDGGTEDSATGETDGNPQWDTNTFPPQDTEWNTDFDTNLDTGIPGCDLPSNFLTVPDVPSYLLFTASGTIEEIDVANPAPIRATYRTKLKDKYIGLGSEHSEMLLSVSGGHHVVIKAFGKANPAGMLRYAEIDIDIGDIIQLEGPKLDMWANNDIVSNLTVYDAVMNKEGQLVRLCQTAAVGEAGEFYLCNTNLNYTNNVGETFGLAGNIVLYDDINFLKEAQGMRCVCENGAGNWRNCDEGTPNAYGLLKFNFKVGMDDDNWFSKYIYNEKILNSSSGLNLDYVSQHPEGLWQTYYGAILGGFNIGSLGIDPMDGTNIYRFRSLITPQNNATVTALVSKDSTKEQIILRQQSFDTTSDTPVGYWIEAYLPSALSTGDHVSFGEGARKAKLFVYDPNDPSNCVLAVACAGEITVEKTTGLENKEGGSLYLKTYPNSNNTRQSVELFHPHDTPDDCDWKLYLSQSGRPLETEVCKKF